MKDHNERVIADGHGNDREQPWTLQCVNCGTPLVKAEAIEMTGESVVCGSPIRSWR